MKKIFAQRHCKIVLFFSVFIAILYCGFSDLFSLQPIIESPSNSHILKVEYYNGIISVPVENYREEKILEILSQAFCKKTYQKNHGYSLGGNGFVLHITFVENVETHNIYDLILGNKSFLSGGRGSYIYQISEANSLLEVLLDELSLQ